MSEPLLYLLAFVIVSFGFVAFFGAPYVPTRRRDVRDIAKIYKLRPDDVFVDIGSGDGVVLRYAARAGAATAIGYELSPWLYFVSKLLCRHNKNITIYLANFWRRDLPAETTVVYTFLDKRDMEKLEKKLLSHVKRTGKPLYFISYSFALPSYRPLRRHNTMLLYKITPLQT